MDGGAQIFHPRHRIRRGAIVRCVKLAHFIIPLWAMGNDTGGIEITVTPPAVAPLGGNAEYATATPTSVNGRLAYAAQHFNGFHIRWTDHAKRVKIGRASCRARVSKYG